MFSSVRVVQPVTHLSSQQYALFTAAPSLIINENESEAVRDRHTSLQWAVLLFNVFSDFSVYETLEKYLSKKFQLTKNSRQCKL